MFDWNETIPGITGSVQSRKPYPEFTKVQEVGNVAEARYNSLAVKLTRRLHQGLSVLAGYTLSKSEDNGSGIRTLDGDTLFPQNSFCLDCEWGLSVFDVRHRFVASILYELPFGDGKPYMQTGIGAAILGGWQISTILNKVERISENGVRRHRPIEHRRRPGPSEHHGTGSDPAERPADDRAVVQHRCVRAAAVGHLGHRRPQHLLRPGHHERGRVDHPELPPDAHQEHCSSGSRRSTLLNNPIWNDPNTTLTSPLYGTITSTRKPMRELQLGLKFVY